MDSSATAACARIGTSAWNKESWKGRFHPLGLSAERSLRYTAERMPTIEVNATWHGAKTPSVFRNWRESTPRGFVFAIKGDRIVTHENRLRNAERALADFFATGVLLLQEKLGPLLWQIEEVQRYDRAVIEDFFAALPRSYAGARRLIEQHGEADADALVPQGGDRPLRHAFEARHPSFAAPAFAEQLHRHEIAGVVANAPGRPEVDAFGADFVYARLHGGPDFNPDGYDEEALERWDERITGWTEGFGCPDARPRDVFAYFDNREENGWHPPFDAVRLQAMVDGPDAPDGPELSIPTTLF